MVVSFQTGMGQDCKYLAGALVTIWLSATDNTVASVCHAFLELLLSALGGIRSDLLLSLGVEILASGVRHDGRCCGVL